MWRPLSGAILRSRFKRIAVLPSFESVVPSPLIGAASGIRCRLTKQQVFAWGTKGFNEVSRVPDLVDGVQLVRSFSADHRLYGPRED